MERQSAEKRYQNDPAFHQLVDMMESAYERLEFTPSDMRQAAMFAALRVELRTLRPFRWQAP